MSHPKDTGPEALYEHPLWSDLEDSKKQKQTEVVADKSQDPAPVSDDNKWVQPTAREWIRIEVQSRTVRASAEIADTVEEWEQKTRLEQRWAVLAPKDWDTERVTAAIAAMFEAVWGKWIADREVIYLLGRKRWPGDGCHHISIGDVDPMLVFALKENDCNKTV